jgi:hypothetical protein
LGKRMVEEIQVQKYGIITMGFLKKD